jgi:hypothetical protein
MAMSISPAQMMLQVASAASAAPARNASQALVPAAAVAVKSPPESPPAAPAISPPASTSTDMRIDDQNQVYYAFVDDRSGQVLFEIPTEALRKIGESLNVPLMGDSSVPSVDVKS